MPPGPSSTGPVGAGHPYVSLTPSGTLNVTTPGAVIDGLDITGTLSIRANNVTVRNTRVRAVQGTGTYTVTWSAVSGVAPVGLLLEDVEIDGNGVSGDDAPPYPSGWAHSAAIQPGMGYTMRRCDVHGTGDGLKPQANPTPIVIEDSWVHDLASFYVSVGMVTHNDILQIAGAGATDVQVTGCLLDGYRPSAINLQTRYASSSLIQWGSFPGGAGVLRNVILEDNWIEGGQYASRLNTTLAVCDNVQVRNNRFGLHHRYGQPIAGVGSTVSADGGQIQVSGNRWWNTGTTDAGIVVTAEQALAGGSLLPLGTYLGTADLDALQIGSAPATALYLGPNLLWAPSQDI